MVFSSTVFLFLFLPIVIIIALAVGRKFANYWLFFASLLFFGWSQPQYLWIIITSILLNYVFSFAISSETNKSIAIKKIALIFCVIINLGILFYFKYFDFFIESINKMLNLDFEIREIILPIGISFFTFQAISYDVDLYRGNITIQKNPIKLGLYIVLFPQLVAGPIVRYRDVSESIENRTLNRDNIIEGMQRFIIGLSKKVLIANILGEMVDGIWQQPVNFWHVAWVGSIAYTFQIYFDFSGYSDMAIGIGKILGFEFPENFNLPYISRSITEFWRRWHITLSSWFKDYVYIPLGGNRSKVYRNLFIIFLLTGLWHGASWNFIVWGLWHGFFVLLERKFGKYCNRIPRIVQHLYTLLVVNIGWVMFRADSVGSGLNYLNQMFCFRFDGIPAVFRISYWMDWRNITVMVVAFIFSMGIVQNCADVIKRKMPNEGYRLLKYMILIVLLVLSEIRVVAGTYNPFIYFQF